MCMRWPLGPRDRRNLCKTQLLRSVFWTAAVKESVGELAEHFASVLKLAADILGSELGDLRCYQVRSVAMRSCRRSWQSAY